MNFIKNTYYWEQKWISDVFMWRTLHRVIGHNPDFHFQPCAELSFQKSNWNLSACIFINNFEMFEVENLISSSSMLISLFMWQEAVNHPVCRFQSLVSPRIILIWMANKSQCRVSARKCNPRWRIKMKLQSAFGIIFLTLRFPQLYEYDDTNWHLESFLRFPSPMAWLTVIPLS